MIDTFEMVLVIFVISVLFYVLSVISTGILLVLRCFIAIVINLVVLILGVMDFIRAELQISSKFYRIDDAFRTLRKECNELSDEQIHRTLHEVIWRHRLLYIDATGKTAREIREFLADLLKRKNVSEDQRQIAIDILYSADVRHERARDPAMLGRPSR